jgi:hypothetical protein
VKGPLWVADNRGQWPIVFLGINPVGPLAMQAPDPRTAPFAKHREGRKIQFDIAMGIGVMFLGVQIGLLIEQAVEAIGGVALGALNGALST